MKSSLKLGRVTFAAAFLLALLLLSGVSALADVIIDNGAAGTSSTGTWAVSGGTTPYGADSLWSRDGDTYTWSMSGQPEGLYDVSMWWSGYASRASSITVRITHRDGIATVTINQKLNAGKWNSLGQYYFNGSGSVTITAANGASVSTAADAVKFAPVVGPPPTEIIIDNGAAGTSSTGTWAVSGGTTPYGANSLWSRDGDTYTWSMSGQAAGLYNVSMWWSGYASRASSITVRVTHRDGTATMTINQKQNAGIWNSLGQYYFNGSGSVTITAANGASVSTCADAVKFVSVSGGGGNTAPVANIESITATPSHPGDPIIFIGTGTDDDGTIKAYNWRSDIDGLLSTTASFTTSILSEGIHTIFFKVQDDQDAWSKEVAALVVNLGCTSPMVIMPLGDSITYGTGEIPDMNFITGYRQPLFTSLATADYYANFVGNVNTGSLAVPVFDIQHQGIPGITASEVGANIYNWLVQNPAKIVLLHIGTNSLTTSPTYVQGILNEIDRYEIDHNTSVLVLLARIINRKTYSSNTTTFNNNVQLMAEARIANGDKIVMVYQESALNYTTDMYDNLHPNNTGYGKMANVWLNALTGVLPVCEQSSPIIFTQPVTQAAINQAYTYTVGAIGSPAPTYQLLTAPPGMTINGSSGQISWTPNADQAGANDVSVRASNLSGTDVQNFSVNVATGIIIDNGAAGTSSTGTWAVSGGTTPYGADSLWSRDGDTYTWSMSGQPEGLYDVSMWWSGYASRASSITVRITHRDGIATVTINQKLNAGKWNSLGQYNFDGSGSVTITAANGSTVSTCADAVKFVYVP